MARADGTRVREALTRFLPHQRITSAARAAGVAQRQRKVKLIPFFWSLVLGFGSGRERSLAGLRRVYEQVAGHTLVPSSFYERLTPQVATWLRLLVGQVLTGALEPATRLRGHLAAFKDLVLTDSTVLRLHDLLAKAFPACRTNHTLAALKMHAVFSVAGAGLRSVKLTSERVHDGPVFQVGKWVKERLLVFDLGYFRFQLMSCITRNGGFFIVRLKKSTDPFIVSENRATRGRAVHVVGKRVSEVIGSLERAHLDVDVQIRFKNRQYAGVRHSAQMYLRLVGVRDANSGEYHLYLTNIPVDRLGPDEIAQTYAARWLIELYFRQLKSSFRLEEFPSRKRHVVEALLYASLLTFAVSQALKSAVQARLRELSDRLPADRWHRLFAEHARELLQLVVGAGRRFDALGLALDRVLLHEAVDPNVKRRLLLRRVEERIQFSERYALGSAP